MQGTGVGSGEWELLLGLEDRSEERLHDRLRGAVRDAIRRGRLPSGTALPPSRRLAAELGCSRWAVTEAYGQLVAEGYLEAVTGSATRVAWHGGAATQATRPATTAAHARFDLAAGLPDLRAFPRRRWAEALRTAVAEASLVQLGRPDPAGDERLRRTLAEYVVRTRGAVATAADVRVTTSATDGLRRLCAVLAARGVRRVACEDPGWTRLRDVVRSAGLEPVPAPVDSGGLRTDVLGSPDVGAVLVGAAHQFPTGVVLAPDRRAALLRWAAERDGVLIEDDYDAEIRYDRAPVAALQGMDPGRVVLLKSVSKTLSPALGLGWMVVPAPWSSLMAEREPVAQLPPTIDQLALAHLVESGAYDRHLRACRSRYRRRRDVLVEELGRRLPDARVTGAAAGLHLVLWLPEGTDTTALVEACWRRGVRVTDLARYAVTPGAAPALVLGYGNITDHGVVDAVRFLAEARDELSG